MASESHESNSPHRPPSYTAILEAAVAEFAEHGRDGMRMERVAERAGLNKSLVYRHFENREKLFVSALEYVFAERFRLLDDLPTSLSGLFEYWTTRFSQNPLFLRMILREALEMDSTSPVHATLRQRYYQQQMESIRRFQQQGELPEEADPESLFFMLTAVVVFPYLLPQIAQLVSGESPHSPQFQQRWRRLFHLLIDRLAENSGNESP